MDLTSKDFRHPYSPYDIQLQFMKELYICIDEGKIGIFESPTGTGKSLSLICGSLTWLRDHKRTAFLEETEDTKSDDEPDWMLQHARRERRHAVMTKRKDLEDRLARVRAAEERQRKKLEQTGHPFKKQRTDPGTVRSNEVHDGDFELDEYESSDEQSSSSNRKGNSDGLSSDTLALLEKFKSQANTQPDFEEQDDPRVIYCSRTHSQLVQFAHELRRVKPLPSILPEDGDSDVDMKQEDSRENELSEGIKHVSLGSRKALCINPKVQRLGNATAINERCLDMQRPGVADDNKCQFLPSKGRDVLTNHFRDHVLAKVGDIEDIGKIGKKIGICPYYASRPVVKHSEVVTLPYPLLLQKSAREALNMSVKDHVIIIDEAHNLMDTISNIHSASVSLTQLRTAIYQLTTYARKFKTRLKGKNRVYIAQVIRLVSSIAEHLESILKDKQRTDGVLQSSDIMSGKGIDQINPHKLSRYLQESKLARKVDGYIEHSQETHGSRGNNASQATIPVIFHVQSFLLPLMNPSDEGRLFFEKAGNDVQLKYLLLDPTNHFREIVEEARAVILAGGTMSPMDYYADHLLSYVDPGRIKTFSYGHVIPRDNLVVQPVAKGALNTEFDFTYEKRNSENMINDLGKTIVRTCTVIPDGVVAFFPSYDYLNLVLKVWGRPSTAPQRPNLLESIGAIKPMFYESQDKEEGVDTLLQKYSSAIDNGEGGLLLAVMGGKLSEGINFSDRLGRGVIVIGLPFANTRNPIWQAKMQHEERKAYTLSTGSVESRRATAKAASRAFYENSCMRTVNQCIGRAIRHKNDYAAILMFDRRYDTPRIQGKLPGWIRESFKSEPDRSMDGMLNGISEFFRSKKEIEN